MKTIYSRGLCRGAMVGLASLFLGLTCAFGQSSTGTLVGRVTDDSSKLALAGARVSIVGTPLETFTDQGGDFLLANVPAGSTTVTFSYVGYPALTLTVEVPAGQTTRLNGVFGAGEVVAMEALKVTGSEVGTARALNEQLAASTYTNIVASDAIGQFLDKNVAEVLQRVPGVDIARDKGEGRFVIIRGLDPIFLGVSMNGIRLSSAEKAARSSALDVMSSNLIASIDAIKVTTPDMETDALGSVNIKTHSGFETEGESGMITAGAGYAHQLNKRGGYSTAAYYTNQFLGGKLGIAVAVAADDRKSSTFSEPQTTIWSLVKSPTDGNMHWLLGGQDFRDYDSNRWRQGGSVSLDYKFNSRSRVWFRFLSSSYRQNNEQWLTTINYGAGTIQALDDTSATVTLPSKQILKSETQIVNNKRISSFVGGWNFTNGPWTNDLTLGYTTGKYTRPTCQIAFSNTGSTKLSYQFTDSYHNVVSQVSGPDIGSPASYSFSTKSGYSNTTSNMHERTVRDDLRYNFDVNGRPTYLKFGMEYRNKYNNLDTSKWAITSIPWTLANEILPGYDTRTNLGGFNNFMIRQEAVQSFYQLQGSYGISLTPSTTYGGAFQAEENITAAYAMGGMTLGKLKVMTGARFENTVFDMLGWQYDSTTSVATPVSYHTNYNNVLPSLVFTYDLAPRTILRASLSTNLARQDYSNTAPGRAINDGARTVQQGNASLPALTSVNWDASIEHYYSPMGGTALAFYYKSIKNFAYLAQAGNDPSTGYLLTTYLNGPSAWVYGVEASWTQRLGFLPRPFNGLGCSVSGILGDSEATYPTRPGEKIPFTGFAKVGGNAAVTYDYSGLHLRVAVHYHGKRLESGSTIGTDATQDQYEDKYYTVDFGSSYSFKQHWQVYLDLANLTNAPLKEYYGGTGGLKRIQTLELYGWSAEGGLRYTF